MTLPTSKTKEIAEIIRKLENLRLDVEELEAKEGDGYNHAYVDAIYANSQAWGKEVVKLRDRVTQLEVTLRQVREYVDGSDGLDAFSITRILSHNKVEL